MLPPAEVAYLQHAIHWNVAPHQGQRHRTILAVANRARNGSNHTFVDDDVVAMIPDDVSFAQAAAHLVFTLPLEKRRAAAMALLACGWGIFNYGSVWYPINVLASVGVPELAAASRETLAHFSAAGLIVGSIAHVTISVLVGLLYTVLLPMLPSRFEWFWGGIVAPVLWSALIFISAGIIAPTLSGEIDWPWFVVCQVAFGLVGGFVVFKSGKIDTMQSWSVAQKMGVEANTGKEHKE